MQIEPYLFFEGRAAEAIEFYRTALSAEVLFVMKNKDSPDQSHVLPNTQEKILHATIRIGATTVMVSDGHCTDQPKFDGFSLSLAADNEGQASNLFVSLAEGGEIQLPLQKTFWSPCFGMVKDKFGVLWMVTTAT
jgi:PhnB protein